MYRIACAYHGSRVLLSSVDILTIHDQLSYLSESYMKVTWDYHYCASLCECLSLLRILWAWAFWLSEFGYLVYLLHWDLPSIAWTGACRPGRRKFPRRQSHNSSRSFLTKGRELEHPSKTTSLPPPNLLLSFPLVSRFFDDFIWFLCQRLSLLYRYVFCPLQSLSLWTILPQFAFFSCLLPGMLWRYISWHQS